MSALVENGHAWNNAGWGVFPLPAGQKSPPPQGWTGRGAIYSSGADVQAWIEEEPDANMGLRFPEGTVGIDVDQYGDKHGVATLVACTKEWGKLPSTWRITSRPEGRSGIYLYRLPAGTSSDRFAGELPGGSVEILRPEHRYAVAPGSLHPEGRTYQLINADGQVEPEAIQPSQLPELPMAWVEGLTLNEKAAPGPQVELVGGRGAAYIAGTIPKLVAELQDIATWPVGKRDERGRGWEKIQADVALRLAELALSDWNPLTMEQAQRIFGDNAPIGDGWTSIDVAKKWRSQMKRAEPQPIPYTQSDDPLAPGYQPPEINSFESAVGASPTANPAQGADFLVPEPVVEEPTAPAGIVADWVKHSWDDMGNAERVVERYGPRLRYLPAADTWMEYDEELGRWKSDRFAGQRAVAKMINELDGLEARLYSDKKPPATGKKDPTSPREDFRDWLKTQRFDSRYRSASNVLKTMGMLNASSTDFDAQPMLLNCRNGVLDLTTGQLLPADPIHMLSRQIPVDYNPDAPAPLWDRYLHDVMPTQDLRNYLQRVVGYSLTGSTAEQAIFIHQGKTQNGKSVFMRVLGSMLGEFSRTIDPSILMSKRMEQHPTGVAGMEGRRMLLVSESAEGARFDEALIKRLSGSDVVTARLMGRDFFDFTIIGKVHMATNHLPHISGDPAVKRRLHLIPWTVFIEPEKRDKDLESKLVSRELAGILAWAVRGALAWQQSGLEPPVEVQMAVDEWVATEDELGQFVIEEIAVSDQAMTTAKQLYIRYAQYCESLRQKPMSQQQLGRKLTERGFEKVHTRSGNAWKLRLLSSSTVDPLAPGGFR